MRRFACEQLRGDWTSCRIIESKIQLKDNLTASKIIEYIQNIKVNRQFDKIERHSLYR